MNDSYSERLLKLECELSSYCNTTEKSGVEYVRGYYRCLREIVHLFEDASSEGRKTNQMDEDFGRKLRELAETAFERLGGYSYPCIASLKDYEHHLYGPFLGVSDEGSAAAAVREAAVNSPKARCFRSPAPLVTGVAVDAERLGAMGETAAGPDEYKKIRLDTAGRILATANIGGSVNLRYYKRSPVIKIPGNLAVSEAAELSDKIKNVLLPFVFTPDNKPRPVTVFLSLGRGAVGPESLAALKAVVMPFQNEEFCDPEYHKIGLHIRVSRGKRGVERLLYAIDAARLLNIEEVTAEGACLSKVEEMSLLPGLINYFNEEQVEKILKYAGDRKVKVAPHPRIDLESIARSIAISLGCVRNMGFDLAKYGLLPLTAEECGKVAGMIEGWFPMWTAAPVLYVDYPVYSDEKIFRKDSIAEGIRLWLERMSECRPPLVLIDTFNKSKGYRILKRNDGDRKGLLSLDDVLCIDKLGKEMGIRILWAGGISLSQVYTFGKLEVFGIYVTSAVSKSIPVTEEYSSDPVLDEQKEPAYPGVYLAKLLLEAGFLAAKLLDYGISDLAGAIETEAERLLKYLDGKNLWEAYEYARVKLDALILSGWEKHFSRQGIPV